MYTNNSFKFNGQYFEDLIEGYTTLKARGREMPEIEHYTGEVKYKDGELYRGKRHPVRELEIEFAIEAESVEATRAKLTQLVALLETDNAQLIFNDEPDKFLVGTAEGEPEVELYKNGASGTYGIICHDVYKYSVKEYVETAELTADSTDDFPVITIPNYGGTLPAKPILSATMKQDQGFVAFFDTNEHIIQAGRMDETDEAYIERKTAQAITWTQISNTKLPTTINQSGGSLNATKSACNAKTWGAIATAANGVFGGFVPARPTAIQDFKSSLYKAKYQFKKSNKNQSGFLFVGLEMTNGNYISIRFYTRRGNTKGEARVYSNRTQVGATYTYNCTKTNKFTSGTVQIAVDANTNKATFSFGGKTIKVSLNLEASDYVNRIYSGFARQVYQKTKTAKANCAAVATNKITSSTFSYVLGSLEDIPNTFDGEDVVEADVQQGTLTLNGNNLMTLGALGNNWDSFALYPNQINAIQLITDEWHEKEERPILTVKYRETFL